MAHVHQQMRIGDVERDVVVEFLADPPPPCRFASALLSPAADDLARVDDLDWSTKQNRPP